METTKIIIFDPLPLAAIVENIAQPYLRALDKVINKEPEYVFDQYGRVVGTMDMLNAANGTKQGRKIQAPYIYPTVGISIIKAYVDRILIHYSAWTKQGTPTLQSIWSEFLIPEYEYTEDVYGLIENLLGELHTDIVNFIGDDKWHMHFLRMRNSDLMIEKTIDYRVHYYMENIREKL
jgi:hypothetical protein